MVLFVFSNNKLFHAKKSSLDSIILNRGSMYLKLMTSLNTSPVFFAEQKSLQEGDTHS